MQKRKTGQHHKGWRAAARKRKEKRVGDAINAALYKTPYNGELNVPCLCDEQKTAAAQAAIAALTK